MMEAPRGYATVVLAIIAAAVAIGVPILAPKMRDTIFRTTQCNLYDVCRAHQERPALVTGDASHATWDLPRWHLKSNFTHSTLHVRTASVTMLSTDPVVVYYENVLSETEIHFLTDRAHSIPDGASSDTDPNRVSDNTVLHIGDHSRVKDITNKVAALAGFTGAYAERVVLNRYRPVDEGPQQEFKPHYDFIDDSDLAPESGFSGCQRAATILMYLTDVEDGGETVFLRDDSPESHYPSNEKHIRIRPKRGSLLVWFNCHPETERVDANSRHAGLPVTTGVKLAATVFVRTAALSTTAS